MGCLQYEHDGIDALQCTTKINNKIYEMTPIGNVLCSYFVIFPATLFPFCQSGSHLSKLVRSSHRQRQRHRQTQTQTTRHTPTHTVRENCVTIEEYKNYVDRWIEYIYLYYTFLDLIGLVQSAKHRPFSLVCWWNGLVGLIWYTVHRDSWVHQWVLGDITALVSSMICFTRMWDWCFFCWFLFGGKSLSVEAREDKSAIQMNSYWTANCLCTNCVRVCACICVRVCVRVCVCVCLYRLCLWLLVCTLHVLFPIFFLVHTLGFEPKSTIGKVKSVDVALPLSIPKAKGGNA